jgi:HlyD family secretion protein
MDRVFCIVLFGIVAFAIISCGGGDAVPGGSGLIEATEIVISAEAAGRMEKLFFDEGDHINSGDAIALIDTTTLSLRSAQARACRHAAETQKHSARLQVEKTTLDISLAEKEYNRIGRLLKTGSANQQQFDQAENRFQQAKLAKKAAETGLRAAEADLERIDAEIALLEKQLADCHPTVPSGGTVVTTYVESGELVSVGKPLIKIARLDTVWVKVYLPPEDLTRIRLGDKAEVDPEDGRDRPLSGRIGWISSEAEFTPKNVQTREARADLVYAVKIIIPNPDETLKIGMPVSVGIP